MSVCKVRGELEVVVILFPRDSGVWNFVAERLVSAACEIGVHWRLIYIFSYCWLQVAVCEIVFKLGAFVVDILSTRPIS